MVTARVVLTKGLNTKEHQNTLLHQLDWSRNKEIKNTPRNHPRCWKIGRNSNNGIKLADMWR